MISFRVVDYADFRSLAGHGRSASDVSNVLPPTEVQAGQRFGAEFHASQISGVAFRHHAFCSRLTKCKLAFRESNNFASAFL
jgi:hypothetical protein